MPALDGLRGLAVMVVVWHNVAGVASVTPRTLAGKLYFIPAAGGWVGVTLFFALSGFLITGILMDMRGTTKAWLRFTERRALRIFPLYFVTLLVAFLLLPTVGMLPSWLVMDREHQFWYWTYLVNWTEPFGRGGPGFSHFWSLAVEEQFYLLWPLLVLTVRSRHVAFVCAGLVVTALVARFVLQSTLEPALTASHAVYSFTICRWDALALGALVAVAARDARWAPRLATFAAPITAASLAAILLLGIARRGFGARDPWMETLGQSLFALLSACVVALGMGSRIHGSAHVRRLLEHPALRATGKYSYAIYVFHFPLCHVMASRLPLRAMQGGDLASALVFAAATAVVFGASFCLALLSWHLLEKRALALRRPTASRA
jgi:peptidoglycan/LPS O-acetylase OafA/YrhL